jgi:hypothetical protein
VVARQANHALDEVLLTGTAHAHEVTKRVPDPVKQPTRRLVEVLGRPPVGPAEDNHFASFGLADVVQDLVDQDPVADQQGLFHRA